MAEATQNRSTRRRPYDVQYSGEDKPRRIALADHQVHHFQRAAEHPHSRVESVVAVEDGGDGR